VVHHRAGLALRTRKTHPPEFVAAVESDWRTAPLEPPQRALLTYAEKLTLHPGDMLEEDLLPLREAGLDDRAILEVNLVVAYFAYANRIADGLGVQLEPEREPDA
jgi:uncharacterized peroxidase-related enzyme